jgi:hypothetical protein
VATLQELETYYSLVDMVVRNEALDVKLEAERKAQEAARR